MIVSRAAAAILSIALFAAPALAQSPEPTPSPSTSPSETPAPQASQPASSATPQPTKFWVELDQSDLATIGSALNELPKRIADPMILKINGMLQAQQQIVANKDAAEKAKADKKGKK